MIGPSLTNLCGHEYFDQTLWNYDHINVMTHNELLFELEHGDRDETLQSVLC